MTDKLEEQLREQLAYYRRRAVEYDDWALRRGRFDRGPEANERWFGEVAALEEAVREFEPRGDVLELACGTGQWTTRVVQHADTLTAVDAAPEVLGLNQERVADPRVRYIHTDLFEWQPPQRYDVVFFSFWLSHVPPQRFEAFWKLVSESIAPGGRVFFIDNLSSETAAAIDPELEGPDEYSVIRRLSDGQEFRVWKVLFQPDELEARLASLGWDVRVKSTGEFFLYGEGERIAPPSLDGHR